MVEYRHTLNAGLAIALYRLSRKNGPINISALRLTRTQWDNFQKLRYWGLVAKASREDGKRIGGAWEITAKGRAFVAGDLDVPAHVWTYRGDMLRYEGEETSFLKLHNPNYKTRLQYAAESVPHGGDLFR